MRPAGSPTRHRALCLGGRCFQWTPHRVTVQPAPHHSTEVLPPALRCVYGFCQKVEKVSGARDAIEAAGASLLALPPYSPDFNPIEMAFSRLEAILGKSAARTIHNIWRVIAKAIDDVTPTNCPNYFAATGYEPE